MEQQTETQPTEPSITETLLKFYQSRTAQVILDLVRIAMLIGVVFLIYYIWNNIELFKQLNGDICAMCQAKSGCYCMCGIGGN
jgi:hypothetical protein